MRFRVLQHEKGTDHIRIGGVSVLPDATIDQVERAVLDDYLIYRSIKPEDFGKYWSRVSIVDPETLSTIKDLYSEK